jgi:hypothetical protein
MASEGDLLEGNKFVLILVRSIQRN